MEGKYGVFHWHRRRKTPGATMETNSDGAVAMTVSLVLALALGLFHVLGPWWFICAVKCTRFVVLAARGIASTRNEDWGGARRYDHHTAAYSYLAATTPFSYSASISAAV